jgi:hypothetical protein
MEVFPMSRRQIKADDIDGMMAAAWDELEDTAKMYHVVILMDIRRKVQGRGFSFHATATRVSEDGSQSLVGTARMDWPSAKYLSVHALLYRLALAINLEVQKEHHERTGVWYSSPVN